MTYDVYHNVVCFLQKFEILGFDLYQLLSTSESFRMINVDFIKLRIVWSWPIEGTIVTRFFIVMFVLFHYQSLVITYSIILS